MKSLKSSVFVRKTDKAWATSTCDQRANIREANMQASFSVVIPGMSVISRVLLFREAKWNRAGIKENKN